MAADNFLWFPKPAKGGMLTGKAPQPEGESFDSFFKSKKALEVLSFSFGVAQAETAGSQSSGAGAGKAKFEEFSIEKACDLSSVPLYGACAAGAHFPEVWLVIRKAGGSNLLYLQYIFLMVFVTGINWSGGSGEEAPKETVKFRFGAMGLQYTQQKPDGTAGTKMSGAWSVVDNKPDLTIDGVAGPSYMNPLQP